MSQSSRKYFFEVQHQYEFPEFSGALQQKTIPYITKQNELRKVKNVDFSTVLGAMRRRMGAQSTVESMPKLPVDADTLGAFIAHFPSSIEIWAAQNDLATSPTEAILQYWNGSSWTNIETGLIVGAEVNMLNDIDEVFVSSYDPLTDTIGNPFTVDSTHDVSTIRQLQYAPAARFYQDFGGSMWAFDCQVGSNRYRDRAYKSSGPTGAITFVRAPQTDLAADFDLVDQVPQMTSNTTPAGTALASSEINMANQAWMAFDNDPTVNHRWISASLNSAWLRYDFGSGNTKIITAYSVVGFSIGDSNDSAPKTWTFEGSPDGSTWTTLDTQTGAPAWAGEEKRTYSITNTTAYEFYRINISAVQTTGSHVEVAEMELLNSSQNVDLLELQLDSVRYIKPGMQLETYTNGTDTKTYDITVNIVDKANDQFTFLPFTQVFTTSNVNTSTDVITVPSASQFTTGTPILFGTSGTLPAPLAVGTTYYAINVSSTTFKVATSTLNASLSIAIDLTTTGTLNHQVKLSYIFGNKDEIWASGRHNTLSYFWNTDYPTEATADWLRIPSTPDALNQIVGVGNSSNRLFMFTSNSTARFDGQNLLQISKDVGCAAQDTIGYYDVYMIWLDSKGKVWVRNESASTQTMISQAIQDTMALIPESQLSEATSVVTGTKYKLYLGQVDGVSIRMVYDFISNQWTQEAFSAQLQQQFEFKFDNTTHPHFFDETGQMWVDEQGNDDNGTIIPFEAETGANTFGLDYVKKLIDIKVYSSAVAATKIFVATDFGQMIDCGQITKGIQSIPLDKALNGTVFNFRFVDSSSGDPVQIDKATVTYTIEEDST